MFTFVNKKQGKKGKIMSILYVKIKAIDQKGMILDYSIEEIFQNKEEMARWFAYGYRLTKNSYSRYECFLRVQRLCNGDKFVLPSFDFEHEDTRTPRSYGYRYATLYDAEYDIFIDLRDYKYLIEKHLHDAVRITESHRNLLKKRCLVKQGRKHCKNGSSKHSTLYKDNFRRSCRYGNTTDDELDNFNIVCNVPKLYRPKSKRSRWEDNYQQTENNWKEKKCRYQWQWHKKGNCKRLVKEISLATKNM